MIVLRRGQIRGKISRCREREYGKEIWVWLYEITTS